MRNYYSATAIAAALICAAAYGGFDLRPNLPFAAAIAQGLGYSSPRAYMVVIAMFALAFTAIEVLATIGALNMMSTPLLADDVDVVGQPMMDNRTAWWGAMAVHLLDMGIDYVTYRPLIAGWFPTMPPIGQTLLCVLFIFVVSGVFLLGTIKALEFYFALEPERKALSWAYAGVVVLVALWTTMVNWSSVIP